VQSEVKSAAPRPLNGRVARLPIVRLELKDALLKSRRVLGCIRSRHFNDHARRLQGPRLHDDAPVRRTAQEEPAAVGADAQLSETQSRPVTGSPSRSAGLPHCSQEFLRDPAKTLPKTANAGEKQNESNLDRKFDQKLKANAIFAEDFLAKTFSTLFVIGTRQMGRPILQVVVL